MRSSAQTIDRSHAAPLGLPVAIGPDDRIARLAGAGHERAFIELYERYHQRLYRYLRSMLRHDADAQDALQSTFAKAFTALAEQRRDAPLRPWLYRIAHNEAVSVMRRRRPEVGLAAAGELPAPSADEQAAQRARLAMLVADLADLTERQRGALVMRELSGLSHAEIEAALELEPGAAKQTIFEARRSLAEFAQGREMTCDDVCRAISEGSGRTLRGRKIRAHLRECGGCAAFAAAIPTRSRELRAIAPPLPAAAAAGILANLLGGHGAGTAGVAGAGAGAGTAAAGSTGAAGTAGSAATATTITAAGKVAAASLSGKVLAGAAVVVLAAGAGGVIVPALHDHGHIAALHGTGPSRHRSPATAGAQGTGPVTTAGGGARGAGASHRAGSGRGVHAGHGAGASHAAHAGQGAKAGHGGSATRAGEVSHGAQASHAGQAGHGAAAATRGAAAATHGSRARGAAPSSSGQADHGAASPPGGHGQKATGHVITQTGRRSVAKRLGASTGASPTGHATTPPTHTRSSSASPHATGSARTQTRASHTSTATSSGHGRRVSAAAYS